MSIDFTRHREQAEKIAASWGTKIISCEERYVDFGYLELYCAPQEENTWAIRLTIACLNDGRLRYSAVPYVFNDGWVFSQFTKLTGDGLVGSIQMWEDSPTGVWVEDKCHPLYIEIIKGIYRKTVVDANNKEKAKKDFLVLKHALEANDDGRFKFSKSVIGRVMIQDNKCQVVLEVTTMDLEKIDQLREIFKD